MAKNETRLKMVNTAVDLFHRKGVNGTSIDDVLKKSRTGKSQFTHYFKTKSGLVHAAVQHLDGMIRNGQTPTGYEIHSWKDLEQWFQNYIDFQTSVGFARSCPMGTIGNDLRIDDSETRADIVTFVDWAQNEITRFFSEKIASGDLPKSTRPQALADLCIATMQGGMLLTKIRRDPKMFESASSEVLRYIKSLRALTVKKTKSKTTGSLK